MEGGRSAETDQALEALREAYLHAERLIEADPDPSRALANAIRLRVMVDGQDGDASVLRDRMVHRVWTIEKLSLRTLAIRCGVSKTRAHQIVRDQGDKDHEEHPERDDVHPSQD